MAFPTVRSVVNLLLRARAGALAYIRALKGWPLAIARCPGWRGSGWPRSFLGMDAKVVLCDFAEVSGGKLFISGAGLALLASGTPSTPYRVNVTLAVIGLITPEDTDLQHKMTIELVHVGANTETRVMLTDEVPDGGDPADRGMIIAYFVAPRSPEMLPNDEWTMPMAIPLFGLGLPDLGAYYFSVRVDGREMDRSSFRIMPPQPAPALGGAPMAPGAAPPGGDGSDAGLGAQGAAEPPL
jgi:hypothetical protein